jgi:alginate O-acetyltransferase complex protein AlgI
MNARLLVYALGLLCTSVVVWHVRSQRGRQIILLGASCGFYASWGPWFLGALVGSSLVNYVLGRQIRRTPTRPWLLLGIAFNVALLGFFKYLPGIVSQIVGQTSTFSRIVLPVGMSFWTFQALSYLLDLYREKELDPTLLEFCLYMTFAPTVLSGPICRLPDMLPQFREYRPLTRAGAQAAAQRIGLGALMMGLAQLLGAGLRPGHGINNGFDGAGMLAGSDVWLLAFGYGFQLFFDFAGYSHIAIGAASLLGIRLAENFDGPYRSMSPSVFWTRWHMSLSSWIRDYVFLPLATMRREMWWRHAALVLSMIIFGLWHKGAPLFVIWGTYHGILLVLHRLWQRLQHDLNFRWEGTAQSAFSWALTFAVMCLGWIFFRASGVKQALGMFATLLSLASYVRPVLPTDLYFLVATLILGYFATTALSARTDAESPVLSWIPMELRYACYAVALYLIVFRAAQPQAFIYSQF